MKKYFPIYLYGAIIILSGIFLVVSKNRDFNTVRITLGVTLLFAAVPAFIATLTRPRKDVQVAYHEIHALTMLVYGIAVLAFGNTMEKLISFTAFLLIFYGASEILFCNWLLNLKQKVLYRILIIRLLLGLAVGFGTVIAMKYSEITLEIYGALFLLIGINVILYVPVMKENQLSDIPKIVS